MLASMVEVPQINLKSCVSGACNVCHLQNLMLLIPNYHPKGALLVTPPRRLPKRSEECRLAGLWQLPISVAFGDPRVSIFQEVLVVNLATTVKNDFPVFPSKGCLPVMFFLIDDILLNYRNLLLGIGKSGIAFSPACEKRKQGIVLHPSISGIFQAPDKLSYC